MKMTPLETWISEKTGIAGRPDSERLRAYQLERLRETLRLTGEKSRFYRERLTGVVPEDILTMDDVARLPFTTPADVAARPEDFLCVRPHEISRIVTLSTSGTTGPPKRIFFTEEDQELTVDFFHRGMTTLVDSGDTVMIFMPGSTPGSVGALLQKGLARFGCRSVVYGPIRDYADAYNALLSERITSVVGIPSQILALFQQGGDIRTIRSALLSADYVPSAVSARLEEAWGVKVFEHYGLTETGLGGGVACQAREGYHLREADLLFEIVNPVTEKPVTDGSLGEVVFSTLTRNGMPLIRYRTGDISRFMTEPCPCGTVLRRLDRVSGRFRERVFLPGGRLLSITYLDEAVFSVPDVAAFSAELTSGDGCDVLTLSVQSAKSAPDTTLLARKIEPLLGGLVQDGRLRLDIRVGAVDYFTTGSLKRRIADNRQP
jgi:phenylacetate-coenzyme A ligase PaaK-like adenylate-forming protein